MIRKINRVEKLYPIRGIKPIKYDTLVRSLTYEKAHKSNTAEKQEKEIEFETFLFHLKTNLLEAMWELLEGEES